MTEFSYPFKVYLEDTDAGGIVYHANYLKFMERGRTEFLISIGFPKPALLEGGLLLVVHSMNIQFLRAAKLGDSLQVTTKLNKLARTYVTFSQKVEMQKVYSGGPDSQLLCEAEVKIACVEHAALKPCPMPAALRVALEQFALAPSV